MIDEVDDDEVLEYESADDDDDDENKEEEEEGDSFKNSLVIAAFNRTEGLEHLKCKEIDSGLNLNLHYCLFACLRFVCTRYPKLHCKT